ncbi:SRPBCC family protein [Kitasatospora sp. NPDC058444]|uniref:SRPBCC family protein n=1 Tax=Kitasatospora sp. NPDC058444 TaxID=3346504 RepID=UPI00364FE8B6
MSMVKESVDVDVPVHTAYNQWTLFEEFPRFMEGVDSVTQLDDRHNHWRTSIGGPDGRSTARGHAGSGTSDPAWPRARRVPAEPGYAFAHPRNPSDQEKT